MPDFPYDPARLVNADKPFSIRWYISFWVWDVTKGCKVRRRDYEVNNYTTIKKRLDFAKARIKEIDKLLAKGFHINAVKSKEISAISRYDENMAVLKALEFALKIKKSENRTSTYQCAFSVYTMFENFVKIQKWERIPAKAIQQKDIRLFMDYLITTRTLGNQTRNSYLSKLKSLFSSLLSREMVTLNPCKGIAELPVENGRNMAYNEKQIKDLKSRMQTDNPDLWNFVQFMFYGFIRPNEIRNLKVGNVDLVNGKIFIPSTIAKNKKSQHVLISSNLKETLIKMQLDKREPGEYIFYRKNKGALYMVPENYMSQQHLTISRDLKYNSDFTLYSWKHTGVVSHYRAGVDIKSLQNQLRHASLMETDIYLKSLGLFDNKEIFDKSPAI